MTGADAFDERVAAHYQSWYETPQGKRYDRLEKESLRELLSHFPDAYTVLEAGSGTGHFTRWMDRQGLCAVGIDLSRPMLSRARELNRVPLAQADAHQFPFADDAFDLVAFITTLEFLEAPAQALTEAVRVACRGVLVGVLNRWSAVALRRRLTSVFRPSIYDAPRFYTVGEVEALLRAAAGSARDRSGRDRTQIVWHTTLFPSWAPWDRAGCPFGGFIGMALLLPGGTEPGDSR